MAVEVAGTFLQLSRPPFPPKTLAFSFPINGAGRPIGHKSSCFIGAAIVHRSHQRGRAEEGRRRVRLSSRAILDGFGFVDDGRDNEDEFVKRIDEFAPNVKMEETESRMNQDAETSNNDGEYSPSSSPVPDTACPPLLSITSEIRSMGSDGDGFAPGKVELRTSCFDLPPSLRILKQKKKKKKQRKSEDMTDSAYSAVKKAFSSTVFIVRELQSHTIRMRDALFSSSNLQIQGILARVHEEVHASFVWLFQRIFSTTPTLMVYLMLLLANFTIFSITDHPAIAKPTAPSSSTTTVEEYRNPSTSFDSSAAKSVGGSGGCGGGNKLQAVGGAADDGRWDESNSPFHKSTTISPESASTASAKKEEDEEAWKGIVEEAERIRASERHEILTDHDTLRCFVSPVTVEFSPDDLSAFAATELSYRRAVAEGFDDPLILSNFAQFLYVVLRDHDG